MATPKPCTEPGCPYKKKTGHPKWCIWHWLERQPIDEQVRYAKQRRHQALSVGSLNIERHRVPESEWPAGERWCGGCQSFVPLFYCRGNSRCWACESAAQHGTRIKATYGISSEEYQALYEWQGGRCYICRRKSTRRLAVDHDHVTGAVRGLLCPDPTRGCNHAILGNIADLDMAKRIVDYLENPPFARLRAGEPGVNAGKPTKRQIEQRNYAAALDRFFPGASAAQQVAAPVPPPEPPSAAPPPVQAVGGYVPRPVIDSPF